MSNLVRVLAIPAGQKKDALGRGVGDDWLLADFGEADDGTHYYLTTDHVHCSEMIEFPQLSADWLPVAVADWINHSFQAHRLRTWTDPAPKLKAAP